MTDQRGAEEDCYMECDIYAKHGACSCSTGIIGNRCPLADHERVIELFGEYHRGW